MRAFICRICLCVVVCSVGLSSGLLKSRADVDKLCQQVNCNTLPNANLCIQFQNPACDFSASNIIYITCIISAGNTCTWNGGVQPINCNGVCVANMANSCLSPMTQCQ